MRILLACILLLFVLSCGNKEEHSSETSSSLQHQKEMAFQKLLDSAQLDGCILVFDPQKQLWYSNDFEYAQKGRLPASTFKIPHSLIALETGAVLNDSTRFSWDGQKRALKIWEQDLFFVEAFRYSCVPCYQKVARKIGAEQMQRYLDSLNYGNMILDSSSVDAFWLTGPSVISPFEQIDFLYRLYSSRLPISVRSEQNVKKMMLIEKTATYELSGKTGWSVSGDKNEGWFVGHLRLGREAYFVATHVKSASPFDQAAFLSARKELSMQAFRELGLLD
jgi:beta-lactamase class D